MNPMNLVLGTLVSLCVLTDLRDGKIYNALVFPTMAAGVSLRLMGTGGAAVQELLPSLLLPLILFLPFWKGKKRGLSAGDIKLLLAVSCCMVPSAYLIFLFAAFGAGAVLGGIVFFRTRNPRTGIPFAVPVCIAAAFHLGGLY